MKKFTLIKEYPGSPRIGAVAKMDTEGAYIVRGDNGVAIDYLAPHQVEDQPEYWSESDTPVPPLGKFVNILQFSDQVIADEKIFDSIEVASQQQYQAFTLLKTVPV